VLPVELWTKETLSSIGNAIRRFVYVDPHCLGAKDKKVAWLLFENDYQGGFPDHLDLIWGNLTASQRLDY